MSFAIFHNAVAARSISVVFFLVSVESFTSSYRVL